MKKILLIVLLAITATALPVMAAGPNFVFILVDDLGCMDISIEGSTFYETPNIDQLASDGMRFTQGYATCQVCSPSRASIMTGKYTPRHGVTDWIGASVGTAWRRNDRVLPPEYARHLPHEDVTVAEAMREGGYKTFFAGKWHLGTTGSHPEDHGFDINKGGWRVGSPAGGFFSPFRNPELKDGPAGESLPVRLAKETCDFIEANSKNSFFAYLSFYSVHGPIQTSEKLWRKYRDKAHEAGLPKSRFIMDRNLPVRQVQDNPIYAGMMESLDDAVGMVMRKLEELKLDGKTVVIFTSDNGGVSSGDAFSTALLPFRGGKGRQWEGGIREPFYIKAPGIAKVGSTCDTPVISTDFYPTILELAGLPARKNQHVDGVSLVPLLKGGAIARRDLFWHYPHYGNQGGEPSSIVRSGDWKLIYYHEDGRNELYNLADDIGEKTDRANAEPELTASIRKKLDAWLKETGAKIPEQDKRFNSDKKKAHLEAMRTGRMKALEAQHTRVLTENWKPNKNWWGSSPSGD